MMRAWKSGLLLLGILLLGIWLGNMTVAEPKADEKNPEYLKMMEHLKEIAREVHPSGSTEIVEVRKYVADEIEKIGCEYTTDSFYVGNQQEPYINIMVTLDVPDTTDGVMLMSHFDSTSKGPGAADDGVSVAAMLVTLERTWAAYEAGKLTNDMYFLFTDGEEVGRRGAAYFVTNYPQMKEKIKLVANIEARGNEGAMLMFQTSENNYPLVRQLKRAVDNVDAFSFAASIYKIMPNNTDLTEFLEAGYTGCLNFAMVDGHETYHRMTDTYENINRDSAYMYYETVTELADYFGTVDLKVLMGAENGIYFSVPGGSIFLCKESVAKGSVIVVMAVALLWLVYIGIKEKLLGKKLVPGFKWLQLILIGALLLDIVCMGALKLITGEGMSEMQAAKWADGTHMVLAVLICVGVTVLTMRKSIDGKSYQHYLLVAMICCLLVEGLLLVFQISLVYLLLGPLVIIVLQSAVNFFVKNEMCKWLNWLFVILTMISVSITVVPLCRLVYDSLGENTLLYLGLMEAFGAYLVTVSYMGIGSRGLKER